MESLRFIASYPSQSNGTETASPTNLNAQNEVSSRPERTRISCHAALDKTACATFRKEGRMESDNATNLHWKSGGA